MLGALFYLLAIINLTLIDISLSSESTAFDKIVGGRKAAPNEFPFQASLQKLSKFGYFHTCGAVLVAPEWLLTAAHCINGNSTNDYKVMMDTNVLKPVSAENFHSVTTIVLKQGFDLHNFNNDIALVQISPAAKSVDVAIKLPDSPPNLNTTATIIGWGATSDGGAASNDLQSAEVEIIPREDCLKYYRDLTESMMCAGYSEGGVDACQGDSGGPLLQTTNGEVTLVGIVSWGVGCAEAGHPGVYTDVASFNAWIRHYIFPK